MKTLLLITKYLPVVMSTVIAVEQTVHATGATKAQVALSTIQNIAAVAGQTLPESQVRLIAGIINSVVDVFNKSGVFTKNAPEQGK